jgi:hypothetical protein
MKITNEVLEGYLNCKTKGHLKLKGEGGIKSDYEAMTTVAKEASRESALANLVIRFGNEDCRGIAVTAATLKQGAQLLVDATLEDDSLAIRFDGLKRADGASKLGDHHYVPIMHIHGDTLGRSSKLLLAVLGLVIARVQGLRPAVGLVTRGSEGRLGKVCGRRNVPSSGSRGNSTTARSSCFYCPTGLRRPRRRRGGKSERSPEGDVLPSTPHAEDRPDHHRFSRPWIR